MFDNLKNLAGLLGNMKEMRERFEKVQQELEKLVVEGDSGAGAVRVTVNGRLQVLSVRLDRPLLQTLAGSGDDADLQMVEDLVTAAMNAALTKAQEAARQHMMSAAGGLNIPGLDQLR